MHGCVQVCLYVLHRRVWGVQVQVCADVCARSSTCVCMSVHVCGCRCVRML